MIPRWIIGTDPTGEHTYAVHTRRPRLIAELHEVEEGVWESGDVEWIDEPDADRAAALMRELGEAVAEWLEAE